MIHTGSFFRKKTVIRYVLPLLAIVVLIVLLTVALLRLATIQREMRHNTNANMVWVVYYAHLETMRLTDVVQKKALNPELSDDPFFRYQMLLSRLNLLQDGPQARFLEAAELMPEFKKSVTSIQKIESLFQKKTLHTTELSEVQSLLSDFSALMLKASTEAMTTQWNELGDGIDRNRNAVLAIIFILIGILLSSLFISAQLLVALKKIRNNERVKQREAELKRQLEHEKKISELHRSFGTMVSHQFRTPLAIIDASMQRLLRASHRMSTEDIKYRALKAKEATERLTHLIESILHADQLVEQTHIRLQSFCLLELTLQLLEEHYASTDNSSRIIFLSHNKKIKTQVMGDPILSTQIIINFISNAEKYSTACTPITISIKQNNNQVCCNITDLGRGIVAADLDSIFQRYFRSNAVSDVAGTGIGLYVAAELAALQQGEVHVESELGVGSTFTLCLPAAP